MRALLVILTASGLLGACAAVDALPEPAGPSSAVAASYVPRPGYDWFLHADSGAMTLVYGLRDSDDVGLSLDCEAGSARIEASRFTPANSASSLLLESGGVSARVAASTSRTDLDDATMVTGTFNAREAVFDTFAELGWIRAESDRDLPSPALIAHPESKANIARFIRACRDG